MRVAVEAWQLRQAARHAIAGRRYADATHMTSAAERLHSTIRGRALALLSSWLESITSSS
jgi:hypothetical protein